MGIWAKNEHRDIIYSWLTIGGNEQIKEMDHGKQCMCESDTALPEQVRLRGQGWVVL